MKKRRQDTRHASRKPPACRGGRLSFSPSSSLFSFWFHHPIGVHSILSFCAHNCPMHRCASAQGHQIRRKHKARGPALDRPDRIDHHDKYSTPVLPEKNNRDGWLMKRNMPIQSCYYYFSIPFLDRQRKNAVTAKKKKYCVFEGWRHAMALS